MTDKAKELQEKEIQKLNGASDELGDLEQLIIAGEKARIPITFNYPTSDGGETLVGAKLKPLTNVEVDNARLVGFKVNGTTLQLELLKKGLYTLDDEPFSPELLTKMATGVVEELSSKLLEISGVKVDKEDQIKFAKDMMGF